MALTRRKGMSVSGVGGAKCSAGADPVGTAVDQFGTNRKQTDGSEKKANNAAVVAAATAAFPVLAPFAGFITGVLNFITSSG
jgi:hypothetical protein